MFMSYMQCTIQDDGITKWFNFYSKENNVVELQQIKKNEVSIEDTLRRVMDN